MASWGAIEGQLVVGGADLGGSVCPQGAWLRAAVCVVEVCVIGEVSGLCRVGGRCVRPIFDDKLSGYVRVGGVLAGLGFVVKFFGLARVVCRVARVSALVASVLSLLPVATQAGP